MEITATLITVVIGVFVSLVVSLLTKFIFDKSFIKISKINIDGIEFQLSESADESTRRILDKVQELQESPQVFLSYSSQDKSFAQHLAKDLREQGIKVWLADEQVKVGDNIIDTIREGISSSQWIIILLSENSLQSEFINKELVFALDEEREKDRPFILPAVISATKLPIQLQDRQYADFSENYSLGLEKLFERIKPSVTRIHIQNRGISYAALGQHERAIEDFNKAIELDPESTVSYTNRGISYATLGQHERAIADFNIAIELDPESVVAYTNRGISFAAVGQHEHAIADFDQAIELDPESVAAYTNQSTMNDETNKAFISFKEKVNKLTDKSTRQVVQSIIDKLEIEVKKFDKADEQTLAKLLRNLLRMSPDIGEVVLATMGSPLHSISVVTRKIVEQIRADNTSDE